MRGALLCLLAFATAAGQAVASARTVAAALWDPGRPAAAVRIRGEVRVEAGGIRRQVSDLTIGSSGGRLLVFGRKLVRAEVSSRSLMRLSAAGRSDVRLAGSVTLRPWKGGVLAVYVDELEDYAARVTQAELPPGWPGEALRAQAVAARSFGAASAGRHAGEGFDVCALTHCQRWSSAPASDAARSAAASTRGIVLEYGGKPVLAAYHSTCGGRTADGSSIGLGSWLVGVSDDGACRASPHYRWRSTLSLGELRQIFGVSGSSLRIAATDSVGRAKAVSFGGRTLDGAAFLVQCGRKLGWARVKSASFQVKMSGDRGTLEGKGLGHGAGMCQWGAAGLARKGKSWKQILALYYPKLEVARL